MGRNYRGEIVMVLDWDTIELVAKDTGNAILIGLTTEFSKKEKAEMSREARKRNLNITLGDSARDPKESNDELYIMAKGTK